MYWSNDSFNFPLGLIKYIVVIVEKTDPHPSHPQIFFNRCKRRSDRPHMVATAGAELGQFQRDRTLTEAVEATVRDNGIAFDSFQYCRLYGQISSHTMKNRMWEWKL